jgi:nitrogen fixation/metabolism regulation signal transduction histidine kinase
VELRASSLPLAEQSRLQAAVAAVASGDHAGMQDLSTGDDTYLTRFHPLDEIAASLIAVLQKSLSQELALYSSLAWQLGGLSLFVLSVAVVCGVGVARGISEPVRRLAAHRQAVHRGDAGPFALQTNKRFARGLCLTGAVQVSARKRKLSR